MSPKNKGNFGKGKTPVEAPDEFISGVERAAGVLKPHVITIAVAAGAVLLVGIGVTTYRWWNTKQAKAATALVERSLAILEAPVVPPLPSEDAGDGEAGEDTAKAEPAAAPAPDEDGDGIPDSFPSEAERAKAALVPLETLSASYGSTGAAGEAQLLQADLLHDLGRTDEALAQYRAYLADSALPELERVARERIGYILEAQAQALEGEARTAKLDEALAMFRSIQPREDGPDRGRALYHEARILEAQGQPEEAEARLEKALEVAPGTVLSYDIKQRLALLKGAN